MIAPLVGYAALYVIAALVAVTLAGVCWRRRAVAGGRALAGLMLALAVWSLAEMLELVATGTSAKIFWSKMSYWGAATCPTLLLAFALEYTRQENYRTPRALCVRWFVPTLTLLFVFTNDWHGWVWNRIEPIPSDLEILSYGHGVWFWINAAYSYGVAGAAIFVLASAAIQTAYRAQTFALIVSVAIPLTFNAMYIFGFSATEGLDISPFAFILGGGLLAFNIFRLRLLDLVPVARDRLIEELSDGVIVLDPQDRIVDINPAAQTLLNSRLAIGDHLKNFSAANSEIEITNRWLDVRVTSLRAPQDAATGHLVVLRDITPRKQMEAALEENAILRERQRLARDLHDSVTQSLNSLVLSAYTATNRLHQQKYDRLAQSIAQMSDGARQALKEMRLLVYDLRLAPDASSHLVEAIRLRLEAVEKRAGIDASFSVENAPPLAPPVEHHAYLIAMEALNNALKHSGATQVCVSLRGEAGGWRLEIRDNGKGFDPHAVRAGGMGLQNLQARAEKIGGTLTLDSAPGQGARIALRVEEIR